MVKMQHNIVIKCVHCDLDDEYASNKFSELLAYDGTIHHQTSCTDTPKKMEFLKENTFTLLRLLVPFYCLLQFLVGFGVKKFLLLFMLLIESHCQSCQVCLLLKNCRILSLILLL